MAVRIAVIDDEPDVLSLLTLIVEQGFPEAEVRSYESPSAVLADLDEPADVVMTDYRLPGMDGIELIKRLRTAWPAARYVLTTAFADSSIEERAWTEAGVKRFLNKVADPEDFVGAIHDAIAASAAEEGA